MEAKRLKGPHRPRPASYEIRRSKLGYSSEQMGHARLVINRLRLSAQTASHFWRSIISADLRTTDRIRQRTRSPFARTAIDGSTFRKMLASTEKPSMERSLSWCASRNLRNRVGDRCMSSMPIRRTSRPPCLPRILERLREATASGNCRGVEFRPCEDYPGYTAILATRASPLDEAAI